jgi:stringent starvation protein B
LTAGRKRRILVTFDRLPAPGVDVAEAQSTMTSNRPYLLRAIYDWISDNGFTPYILVDAGRPGVRVPPGSVRDGKVVLNIAMRAVANLELGNDRVRCMARFGGVSQPIDVPVSAVEAIYAQENGQGMMFPSEPEAPAAGAEAPEQPPQSRSAQTVTSVNQSEAPPAPPAPDEPPPKGPPKLRVVK